MFSNGNTAKAFRFAILLFTAIITSGGESRQGEPSEKCDLSCGPRAISLACRLIGKRLTDEEIIDAFDGRIAGVHSYDQVLRAAHKLDLHTRIVRYEAASPRLLRLPLVVAVRRPSQSGHTLHFVVFYTSENNSVQLLDYPHHPRFVSAEKLVREWDGYGFYVAQDKRLLPSAATSSTWVTKSLLVASLLVACVSMALFFRNQRRDRRTTTSANN